MAGQFKDQSDTASMVDLANTVLKSGTDHD